MRVLHIGSGNLYGGVERTLLTLHLHKSDCPDMEPHFAYCFEGRLSKELRSLNAPLYFLGSVRARWLASILRARRNLTRLLHREHFDCAVAHSTWAQAIFGPAFRKAGIPNVLWMHDIPNGKHWLQRWARLHPPDFVLCNSKFTQGELPRLYPGTQSSFSYCPVLSPKNRFSDSDRKVFRENMGISPEEVAIIQVSRMESYKGHRILIDSLADMAGVPDWVCWIVGGGQRWNENRYLDSLKLLATRYGIADRVSFLGQRSDVPELLHAADIFVQPNTGPEAFGIAFVEALHAGLPVVTTNFGGGPEVVNQSCGVLVPPGDTGALTRAIRKLVSSPALRVDLGKAGPARADMLTEPRARLRDVSKLLSSVVTGYPANLRGRSRANRSRSSIPRQLGPLRVLHVHTGNLHGGVETTLKLLALEPELCPEMDQNIALCFEGRLTREISSAAHRVHLLGAARLGNPWSTRRARAALTKLLTAQHFDRAITHSPWGQVMFGPVLRKAAIHTTLWLHDLPDGKHWLQRWARFQPPDFVLCNSRFTQSVLQNLYPQVPAGYMYPPVVNGTHGFSPTNRDAIRAELNLPKDLTVIIQVGRMEPFKGHGFMLEALSHLRDVHGWICLIVGGIQREKDGEYMRNLQARAVSLGISNQVRFMGEREDVSRLLVASDIYAQGNIGPEPFGITFIEALYAGLPVVTPAMGGALEIVTSDCGILVPPGQAVIFGQALKALIGDPEWRSHLSSAARKRAKLLCDPVRQAHQLYEILASDQG